jgi:hypothetical protein
MLVVQRSSLKERRDRSVGVKYGADTTVRYRYGIRMDGRTGYINTPSP